MAERSLSERVSLALQEQIYSLAASVNQSVDEVIGAVENVVKAYERETTPTYTVNLDSAVDPKVMAEEIASHLKKFKVRQQVEETGGREITLSSLLEDIHTYLVDRDELPDRWNHMSREQILNGYRIALTDEFKRVSQKEVLRSRRNR